MNSFIQDYRNVPSVKGVQKSYYWSEIETAPGVYDFSKIDADIAKLASAGKKLALIIGYKYQISDTQSSLPKYVLNQPNATVGSVSVPPYYEQGHAGEGAYNQGQIANFGHPGTLTKFNKLLDAISKKYDNNTNLASLSFIETSSSATITAARTEIFLDGVIAMERHAACAFKHTPLFQNLNWPRDKLKEFTNNLKAYGIGLGGPDTFFDAMNHPDEGLGRVGTKNSPPGVYHYYPPMSEIVPIGQQVHYANLLYPTRESMLPPPGHEHNLPAAVSVDKVYDFAVEQLKPNYMFWLAFEPHASALEARLKSSAGLPLRKGCPPVYGDKCTPTP